MNRLGKSHLGPMQGSQVEPGFTLNVLPDDHPGPHSELHRLFNDVLVDLDQLGRMLDNARFGVAAVSFTGKFSEAVLHRSPGPEGTVAVDSQLGSQFIGGLEADSPDVVGELEGIGLDLGDGLLAVGAVDPHRPTGSDAMLGQKEHDLANFLLLLPTLANPLEPLLADSLDVEQEVRGRLDDFESPFFVECRRSWPPASGRCCESLLMPEYRSMPSAEAGWVVLSSSALNCCPCSRSTTQRPVASRCSPAETEVVLPTTVTKSWRPLTCTLRTANPFSGLW